MAATDASAPLYMQAVKDAQREVRMGFIRKVYGILSAQLLLTVAIAIPFQFMSPWAVIDNQWILWVSTIGMIVCMCSMICCVQMLRKYPQNYIFLFVLTAFMGVLVGFTSAMYTWQSVVLAVGITVGVFLSMTAFACFTKTDFTGYWPYLFGALSALCLFGLVIAILSACGVNVEVAVYIYDIIGVLIFTFYIIFDTQMIVGGGHKNEFGIDDYAFAALILYLDIINLFLLLLELLGKRR